MTSVIERKRHLWLQTDQHVLDLCCACASTNYVRPVKYSMRISILASHPILRCTLSGYIWRSRLGADWCSLLGAASTWSVRLRHCLPMLMPIRVLVLVLVLVLWLSPSSVLTCKPVWSSSVISRSSRGTGSKESKRLPSTPRMQAVQVPVLC